LNSLVDREHGNKLIKIRNFQALFEQDNVEDATAQDVCQSRGDPEGNTNVAGASISMTPYIPLSFKSQQLSMLEL